MQKKEIVKDFYIDFRVNDNEIDYSDGSGDNNDIGNVDGFGNGDGLGLANEPRNILPHSLSSTII